MKENGKTSTISPEVYAEDVVELSQRMKDVDSTILIGANALQTDDWITILNKAAEHIDFLVVHPYPFYGWKGYDTYLRKDTDALYCVRFAKEAIKANATASQKQLKIMATEFAAGTFDEWDRSGVSNGVFICSRTEIPFREKVTVPFALWHRGNNHFGRLKFRSGSL